MASLKTLIGTTALGTTLLISAPAFAQSTAPDTAPQSKPASDGITEVVVTATRRQTNVQKTSISMEVISGDELLQRGITDVTQLALVDASVNVTYSTGLPIIAVRGVSSQNTTEVGDPAVSVAMDGVFMNRPYGLFGGMYDVARVEVLRGPQGTLFGRNSTGGTMNIISQHPTKNDEGRVTVELGDYNTVAADGFVNLAVSDRFQLRASFQSRNHDGYRDNTVLGTKLEDENLQSVRLQAAFQPTDSLSGWVFFQQTNQNGTGSAAQTLPFTYINGTGGEPVHALPSGLSSDAYPEYWQPVRHLRSTDIRASLTYSFGSGLSLTYLGGYNKTDNYYEQSLLGSYYGAQYATTPFIYSNKQDPETINQEIRLASAPDARLNWQVGAYYFKETNSVSAYTALDPKSSAEQRGVQFDFNALPSESKAYFGQASYGLTDRLKLTMGARYTEDTKAREGTFTLFPLALGAPFTLVLPFGATAASHKTTGAIGLDYQATPKNLFYGKVSTGYKAGGYNDATSSYGPETLISYELGTKNRFFNNHLQFNAALFKMDYTDQQVTQFVSGATSSGSMTVNAGASEIYGLETSLTYNDATFGNLNVSANYTHARYKDFVASAGWDSSVNLDLSGNTLPQSPEFVLTAQYERPFALSSGAEITPSISVKTQSKQYFSANNYADAMQPSYTTTDLSLIYTPAKGNWSLQGYVKNATDEKIFLDAEEMYTFNMYYYAYAAPRTYGVKLTLQY